MKRVMEPQLISDVLNRHITSHQLQTGLADHFASAELAWCFAGKFKEAFAKQGVGHVHLLSDLLKRWQGERAGLEIAHRLFTPQVIGGSRFINTSSQNRLHQQ